MNADYISMDEAAKMLEINVHSLMMELKKPDCPYGYCFTRKEKPSTLYYISRKHLEKWIKDNPQKYHGQPGFVPYVQLVLEKFSTEDLLDELKRRTAK